MCLKSQYNQLLARYYAGCKWTEDNKDDKYVAALVKMTFQLSDLLYKIAVYTDVESMEGFIIREENYKR